MTRRTANLLLLLAGAAWGMGFIAQQTAMGDIGPMLFIGLRFLLAGCVVLPFAVVESKKNHTQFPPSTLKAMLLAGTVFFVAMALQQVGLLTTTVTNAGFLTGIYVVMVPMLLWGFFRETQAREVWLAALLSVIGVYLLSGGNVAALTGGDLLVLSSAVLWATHLIVVSKVVVNIGAPVTMATAQFFVCGILGMTAHFLAPTISTAAGSIEPAMTAEKVMAAGIEIIYAGVVAGAFAFTLQIVGQKYTSAASAAILMSSESLFAAIFGAILLGDRLPAVGYFGCVLIFSALILVELIPTLSRKRSRQDEG